MQARLRARIKRYRLLLENIAALFSIRMFEYALSLVTIPYLVRVLGPGHFGALALAQGIVQYGVLLTDYGFNLTGPKNIAVSDCNAARTRVFSAIMGGKGLLCCLVTVAFFTLWLFADMRGEAKLYASVYLLVVGNVLFPVWFFQGVQKMRYITLANLAARLFTTAGIFVFVETQEDYVVAALLQSLAPVVAGLVAWTILYREYRYLFVCPKWAAVTAALKEGWRIFLSTVAINAYTASNVVILGLLTDTVAVGYFSAAQKIVGCVTGLLAPVSQAVYPHVSRLAAESREETLRFLRKYIALLGGGNFLIGLLLCGGAPWIVKWLLGSDYGPSVAILRLLAWLPFVIAFSNTFGIQIMLPFNMQKCLSQVVMQASLVNLCLVVPLAYIWHGKGVALAMLFTETFVSAAMGYRVTKYGLNPLLKMKKEWK